VLVFAFMTGIYKITSPSGRIYIGQSITIQKRFNSYKRSDKKNESQIKLFNSFKKYGVENHLFEIIEQCDFNLLNERERYWQDFYNVLDIGLNCNLTKTNQLKLKFSKETIEKISKSKIGNKYWVNKNHSLESKNKMSLSKKNLILSDKTKQKISLSLKNHIVTDFTKNKISKNNGKYWLGKKRNINTKNKMSESKSWNKIVLDVNTGVFYKSISDAEKTYNIKNLSRILNGKRKNKTSLILV
jgi:group I intron endonuclease